MLAALVLCLNLGVDPPEYLRPYPCAVMEAWTDPSIFPDAQKAVEQIGKMLQRQFERIGTRTRFKQCLDPSLEDIKKMCIGLRRTAKDDRILFYYNGHGVSSRTDSGDIWAFNKKYTQNVPISIYELQSWLSAPSILVYDCPSAGKIISNFMKFIKKRKSDELNRYEKNPGTPSIEEFENCIQLAACSADEVLPIRPDLPADLFTSCLTTPVEISIRWFVLNSPVFRELYTNLNIPGDLGERHTPLGELNWIFTSITDTIAWTLCPLPLFRKLFRQDIVVAALFRNFLLAERIMRSHNCHPVSHPALPATYNHHMWDVWDLAVHECLFQLPLLHAVPEPGGVPYEYKPSQFFEDQLTAFEIWIKYNAKDLDKRPDQLPVLLQILLSHGHRLKALALLSKYVDLGPKAVEQALAVGIFPYILKLLQSPAPELRHVLVFIWAKIMAVNADHVKRELIKDNSFAYFIHILVLQKEHGANNMGLYELKASAAFIISEFCRGFKLGQKRCMTNEIFYGLLTQVAEPEAPTLRQWSCICLAQLWSLRIEAKLLAIQEKCFESLCCLLSDPVPEVRTACIFALTTFISSRPLHTIDEEINEEAIKLAITVLAISNDGSFMVRREVVIFFSIFVKQNLSLFLICAFISLKKETNRLDYNFFGGSETAWPASSTIYKSIWHALLVLSTDSFPEVARDAQQVIDYVLQLLNETILKDETELLEDLILKKSQSSFSSVSINFNKVSQAFRKLSLGPAFESQLSLMLKRSVFFAASIYQYWGESSLKVSAPIFGSLAGNLVTKAPYENEYMPKNARYNTGDSEIKRMGLPLASGFLEWAIEHFHLPQIAQREDEEPGSKRYTDRLWRRDRNEQIKKEIKTQRNLVLSGSWKNQIAAFNNKTQGSRLIFAQFEPHLAVMDDRDGVSIWDWNLGKNLNRFCNANPVSTRITEIKFINENYRPLLLTGSSEGVVRIYRYYDARKHIELVSSWKALDDVLSVQKSSGLIADWQQSQGSLLVGVDVRSIRVWDAPREKCVADIFSYSDSPVTSLTSDPVSGNYIIAGFGDGYVRTYDRRLNSKNAKVKSWNKHHSWVLKVKMQQGGAHELVSGSVDGSVCLWDIRHANPILEYKAHETFGMSAMDIHEQAPIIVTGSQKVHFWSTLGKSASASFLSSDKDGYLGASRALFCSSLAFHPQRLMLALNNKRDANISIFRCK